MKEVTLKTYLFITHAISNELDDGGMSLAIGAIFDALNTHTKCFLRTHSIYS